MNEEQIQGYVKKGYLRAAVIFEVIGKPKEHIDKTLRGYIERIKQEKDVLVANEAFDEVQEVKENNFFSAVAELEMLFETPEKLNWLCINFSPASIELIEPESITLKQQELTLWVNDMLSRMHQVAMQTKQLNSEHQGLIRNFNAMTRNAILLTLREPLEINSIARKIGLDDKTTQKFLDALITENKIMKDKSTYKLIT